MDLTEKLSILKIENNNLTSKATELEQEVIKTQDKAKGALTDAENKLETVEKENLDLKERLSKFQIENFDLKSKATEIEQKVIYYKVLTIKWLVSRFLFTIVLFSVVQSL